MLYLTLMQLPHIQWIPNDCVYLTELPAIGNMHSGNQRYYDHRKGEVQEFHGDIAHGYDPYAPT